jgi:glycerol-3-phosphate acyltransferase PlsY
MDVYVLISSLIIGYLLGSISFTRLFARFFIPDEDIEETNMDIRGTEEKFSFHSVSATTMAVKKGPLYGMTVSFLDMLKAYIPVQYYLGQYPNEYYYLAASVACIFGHNFPVFHRFRGGRGMSPLFGSLFVIDWKSILISSLVGMFLGLVVLRDMFFAFTSGPLFLIPYFWVTRGSHTLVFYSLLVNVVFWVAVLPEIYTYLELRRKGVLQEAERLEKTDPRKGGILGRFARIFKIIEDDDRE